MIDFNFVWQRHHFNLALSGKTAAVVTGIMGPSGSGKSSLLSLIAGFHRPDTGWLRIHGKTVLDTEQGIFLPSHERNIAIVQQDALLFPHLSVRDNLLYGYRRKRPSERRFIDHQIIDLLDIAQLLNHYPRHISGGEAQRVALGRALLSSPELLLFDEPLSALDFERKQQLKYFFTQIKENLSLPIFYVTHDIIELTGLADTIWSIKAGQFIN